MPKGQSLHWGTSSHALTYARTSFQYLSLSSPAFHFLFPDYSYQHTYGVISSVLKKTTKTSTLFLSQAAAPLLCPLLGENFSKFLPPISLLHIIPTKTLSSIFHQDHCLQGHSMTSTLLLQFSVGILLDLVAECMW